MKKTGKLLAALITALSLAMPVNAWADTKISSISLKIDSSIEAGDSSNDVEVTTSSRYCSVDDVEVTNEPSDEWKNGARPKIKVTLSSDGDAYFGTGINKSDISVSGNDANVAALGEMWQGGGKGYSNLVAVTLGTGVGGGIIIDGRILTGTNGAGGEIGHIHIEDNETEVCGCKNKGCLEQYASATGITRLANRRLAKDDAPSILRGGEISAKTVFDAVKAGDKVAIEIAEQFGEYLGKGLAAVASVVDPQIFVIGGGVSKAGDILFKYIEPSYKRCAFGPCKQAKFALAELGNDAGIYGAAALVLK